jgi:MSHA pilin protein MshA
MKTLNKQTGFTLIELVIVIVILGILAATAAPKFIDLQGDAKGATLDAVKAAIETSVAGVHAKSLIKGNDSVVKASAPTVTVNGATVEIGSGWPLATADNATDLLDIDLAAFDVNIDGTSMFINIDGATASSEAAKGTCYVQYQESTSSTTKPSITIDKSGC